MLLSFSFVFLGNRQLQAYMYHTIIIIVIINNHHNIILLNTQAFDFGAALSYLIIAGDTSTEVMKLIVGNEVEGLREICILVLSVVAMLPLCSMRGVIVLYMHICMYICVCIFRC
jgi:hypothetical protein